MSVTQARAQLQNLLREQVDRTRYPSPPMLDRLERQLRSRADAEAYLALLLTKVDSEYPSPPMLGRIERVVDAIDAMHAREQREG